MKYVKIAAACAALTAILMLGCAAASPVFSPRSPMADTTSAAPGGGTESSLMEGAESFVEDMLPGGEGEADSSLGDTNGDGVVESGSGTGAVESMMGADSESGQTDKDSSGAAGSSGTNGETDTAQSSSGSADKDGMGVFGVILTVVIIGAAAALLFALWPKKRNG